MASQSDLLATRRLPYSWMRKLRLELNACIIISLHCTLRSMCAVSQILGQSIHAGYWNGTSHACSYVRVFSCSHWHDSQSKEILSMDCDNFRYRTLEQVRISDIPSLHYIKTEGWTVWQKCFIDCAFLAGHKTPDKMLPYSSISLV